MRRIVVLPLLFLLAGIDPMLRADEASDLKGARAVFLGNIEAIRSRDRERYLSYYLHDPHLVLGGPSGFTTGFDAFAKQVGERWPDVLEATDIHIVRVRPGIVYGTYRYRVRYGAEEHQGLSERVFVDTDGASRSPSPAPSISRPALRRLRVPSSVRR